MRKSVIGVIVLILMLFAIPASVHAAGTIRFGLKGGVNMANMTGENIDRDPNWKSKIGPVAGAFVAFPLGGLFEIQPEFLYSMKGATWRGEYYGYDVTSKAHLTYVEIPLLVKFYFPVAAQAALRPNIFVGPYAGIKVSAKKAMTWSDGSDESNIEDLKSTDFGLAVGGGIDFSLGRGKIVLDVRYSFSLSTFSNIEEAKNKVFAVLVGYAFN